MFEFIVLLDNVPYILYPEGNSADFYQAYFYLDAPYYHYPENQ